MLCLFLSVMLMLWPSPSEPLNADLLGAELARAGYAVELSPSADGATSMRVHDPIYDRAGWPALRVWVYPSEAAATHARVTAGGAVETTASGPRLLSGYGASAWWANIAMVQLRPPDDPEAFVAEPDCAPADVRTDQSVAPVHNPGGAVETRFLALVNAAAPSGAH